MRVFVLLKEISYFENAKPNTETTKEINVSNNWKRFQLCKVNKKCKNNTFWTRFLRGSIYNFNNLRYNSGEIPCLRSWDFKVSWRRFRLLIRLFPDFRS